MLSTGADILFEIKNPGERKLKQKIQIAVRELVEHVCRSGNLELDFLSVNRAVEAIRAHQRIQKSRPDTYIAELPVSLEIEAPKFILRISGRIDGVYQDGGRVVIEEIKTTSKALDSFENAENRLHWGQLKSYAYIYAVENGLETIEGRLTYYQLDTGDTREFCRCFSRKALEVFFRELVSHYLDWAETIVNWGCLRDGSIRGLEFPFISYREGQRRMAVEVYKTIKNGGQLIAQAPTGIGKTMAAVFPAIRAIGEGLTSKIFYLTARTTGKTVAEKALDDLRAKGLRMKSLTLTAKDRICFLPGSACNAVECSFAEGHFDRINEAVKEVFQYDAFTRETIEQAARKHRVCPFEFSLELSLRADCIICDYNYAFDPKVYLRRHFTEEKSNCTFLIDEAHNLVDRAREMFSGEIRKESFLELRRAIGHELPSVRKSIGRIHSWLVKAGKRFQKAENFLSEKEAPQDLYPLLRSFLRASERWLTLNLKVSFREKLLDLYFAVNGFIRVTERFDDSYVTCFEKLGKDLRLKLFCVNPSENMKQALCRCRSSVFFSATMIPAGYFLNLLGCGATASLLTLPSPFPEENLCVVVSNRISTLYRQRDHTKSDVASAIRMLVKQKKGNYLLFFPSYEYMMMVHDSFAVRVQEIETIFQTPGMSEEERERFLERFGKENPNTLVGFAVMGGVFGEGIDLFGDRLCGAVIVGVGLPGVCPERELIREYFDHHYHAGFEFSYMYPGLNRVLQAAGRVIRSERDRGAVLLIDKRFSTSRYRSLFPVTWHPFHVKDDQELQNVLKRFWKT